MRHPPPPAEPVGDADLPYLPIFLTIRDRRVLLVGGGEAAAAKLTLLRRAGARIRLVAEAPSPALVAAAANSAVDHVAAPFEPGQLDGATLVIDASGVPAMNAATTRAARAAGLPINVVDNPALCDFILPAILDRSPLVVAFSTGGAAPVVARLIRQKLETLIPPGFGRLVTLAAGLRRGVATRITSPARRMIFWDRLFHGDAAVLALTGREREARQTADRLLTALAGRRDAKAGAIWLLGIIAADIDLLTLRAVGAIQRADVLLHSGITDDRLFDFARRDVPRIRIDDPAGEHATSRPAIGRLLVEQARSRGTVVRLAGGDAGTLCRLREEALLPRAQGIETHILPGTPVDQPLPAARTLEPAA